MALSSSAALAAHGAGLGPVLRHWRGPGAPSEAGPGEAGVHGGGLICSSVDGSRVLIGIDILEIVVILVVDIKGFTMNKTFTTFGFLWLLLFGGNFIIKGFKLVQEIGIHYIMIIP